MRGGVWKTLSQIQKETEPVVEVEVVAPVVEVAEEFVCDVCKKVCKNKLGLLSHKRTHK